MAIVAISAKLAIVPHLVVSSEATDDGEFQLSTEYGFVRDAYNSDGTQMTWDQLKKFAGQKSEPRFTMEIRSPDYHGQW